LSKLFSLNIFFNEVILEVELAGLLSLLGSKTYMSIRHAPILRTFDELLQSVAMEELEKNGVNFYRTYLFIISGYKQEYEDYQKHAFFLRKFKSI
jgi:hypothetical protein